MYLHTFHCVYWTQLCTQNITYLVQNYVIWNSGLSFRSVSSHKLKACQSLYDWCCRCDWWSESMDDESKHVSHIILSSSFPGPDLFVKNVLEGRKCRHADALILSESDGSPLFRHTQKPRTASSFLSRCASWLMQRCRYTPESVSNASRSPPTWGHDTLRLRSCSCCWHRWWAASRTRPLHSFAWHNNGTPSLRSSALTLSDSASVISLCTVGNTFPWVGLNRAVPQDCCTLGISASATIE